MCHGKRARRHLLATAHIARFGCVGIVRRDGLFVLAEDFSPISSAF